MIGGRARYRPNAELGGARVPCTVRVRTKGKSRTCPLRADRRVNAGYLRSLADSTVYRLTCGQAG